MTSIENLILHQGLLSQEDIEEVHRVFVMVDVDGTGFLTPAALRDMAVQITRDPGFTFEEARQLHAQLDTNCDGKVSWEEFLQFVCRWLHERGYARMRSRTDLPSSLNEKETLHKCLAQLFALGKVDFDTALLPSDHLDNRAETWDYLGEGQKFSEGEKANYYAGACQTLATAGYFQRVLDEVMHTDASIALAGLKSLRDLFGVLNLFQTPSDRFKTSQYLLPLFETVMSNSGLILRVLQFLGAEYPTELQWEALKILTFFAPGPRVPGLPESHPLHPRMRTTKLMVLQAGAGTCVIALCESKCVEVRDQALLALGFIARHDPEERDFMCALGAGSAMLRILKRGVEALRVDLPSVIRAAWVLSILCGATMPREAATPKFSPQDLADIADTLAKLFTLHDQENLIANSLTALAYTLPYLYPDESCKQLLEKVVYLIHHPNATVKRAALQAVRNVIWASPSQSQMLTEVGLYGKLNEILSFPVDFVVKLDAFTVFRSLIQKGYTWEMINLSVLTTQLQLIIATDPDLRDMIRAGMTHTLFQYMICFKEVSPVLVHIYGVNCFTYNFSYLNDCALILDRFALLGWPSGDVMISNAFAKYFDREEATYLFEVVKVLTNEVRKGNQDLYQLNHGEVNLEKTLCDLLEHFLKIHSSNPAPSSKFLLDYLNNTLSASYPAFFKSVLKQTNFNFLTENQVTAETILNRVRSFVAPTQNIKCMEEQGYPNGDNRLIQGVRREDLNFYSLKRLVEPMQIGQQYGFDKNLQFVDPKGDKITIHNEEILRFVIFSCVQSAFESYLTYFQTLGQPVPSPIELPTAELRLIVSGGQFHYAPYTSPSPNIGSTHADWNAYMFKTQKDQFLKDLAQRTRLDIMEIAKIYDQFSQASAARGSDGRVELRSFETICRLLFTHKTADRELFRALEVDRSGFIDFKGFIEALGILRSGNIEDKLLLAFRAYDVNANGWLEKEEITEMIRHLADLKGELLTQYDASAQVALLCEKFDFDRDGQLNFQEFRAAGLSTVLSLTPFFSCFSPAQEFRAFSDSITCYRCSTKFLPAHGFTGGLAKLCPSCTISTPRTPSRYY